MFRGPVRRGPGLIGAMVTTAVVAGTATATGAAVGRRQARRHAQTEGAMAQQAALRTQAQVRDLQHQLAALQAQQAAMATFAGQAANDRAGGSRLLSQLEQLAQLKNAGMLS